MSFIVQIIDAALPGESTQRQRLIDRLVEEYHANDSDPGEALAKFYQQLVAQYPCLSTYKADLVEECVWGDDPLIANFGLRIAVLDITQNEEQVLAFILKVAGDLNLKVVDVQTDIVYYPKSQEAIDFIVAYETPVVKEKSLTEKGVLDYLVTHLMPFFEPAGFVWIKKEKWFQRSISYGDQCNWISVEKKRGKFALSLGVIFKIPKVRDLARELQNNSPLSGHLFYDYKFFTGEYFEPRIGSVEELTLVTKNLQNLVYEKILPFLEASLSFKELHKLTNVPEKCGDFLGSFDKSMMILAYLAEPSKIRETADFYRNYIKSINYSEEAYQKPIDDIVNKLIELNPTL